MKELRSSPLGHRFVFAHPQILETIKNKICFLNNHKGLSNNEELDYFKLHMVHCLQKANLSRLGKVALLSNNYKCTWRMKQKKERNVFQTKE